MRKVTMQEAYDGVAELFEEAELRCQEGREVEACEFFGLPMEEVDD